MSTNDFTNYHEYFKDNLTDANNPEINQRCIEFENLILNGSNPEIESFISQSDRSTQSTLLTRLILIEVRHRVIQGESPAIDEYLHRFPADAENVGTLKNYFQRIYQEFKIPNPEIIKSVRNLFKKLPRFEFKGEIGSGTFGNVWLAWDSKLQRHVAFKTFDRNPLHDNQIDPVIHEATCTAQLAHPNIVSLHDYGTEGHLGYLVMEYLPQGDLKKLIKKSPINVVQSATICLKLARALHHAHTNPAQIIHRDIKPSNILFDENGEPKICDFGIAKSSLAQKTISKDSKLLGTPAYMAPEQIRNVGVGPSSDVYSLGIVLFEMLTGKPPFTGDIRDIVFSAQFHDTPSLRAIDKNIPKDLETICHKATTKLKKDRYQTAEAFADDLELFLNHKPILAKPLPWNVKVWRKIKANSIIFSLSFISLILIAFSSAMYFKKSLPLPGHVRVHVDSNPTASMLAIVKFDPFDGGKLQQELYQIQKTPSTIDLKSGFYRIFSFNKEKNLANVSHRFIPENIHSMQLDIRRNTFIKHLKNDEIGWSTFIINPSLLNKKLILVDLSQFRHLKIVQDFFISNPDCKNHKFSMSQDTYRYQDLLSVSPESFKNTTLSNKNLNDQVITVFNEAEGRAERCGRRLPTNKEYEMAYLYQKIVSDLKQQNSDSSYYDLFIGLDDDVWEWTISFADAALTEHEEKINFVGYHLKYPFQNGTNLEQNGKRFQKDMSNTATFRLVKHETKSFKIP